MITDGTRTNFVWSGEEDEYPDQHGLYCRFWDGSDNDTPLDEAPPEVAWSPSPYGALSHAQATPFWRVREEEA